MGQFGDGHPWELSHLGFALRGATDLDGVARAVLRDLTALPGVSRAGIGLMEGGGRRLRFLASDSRAWCHIDAFDEVPLTVVARGGQPLLGGVGDFGGRFSGLLERQRAAGTRALAALPLTGPTAPIGGLIIYFDQEQAFATPERRVLETAARRTADAVLRVRTARRGTPVRESDVPEQGPLAATLVLGDDARAAGTARRFLRGVLQQWGVGGDDADNAELCLSELVTNAVIHAGTTSLTSVTLVDGLLTVSVRDHGGVGDSASMLEDEDPLTVFGRGLLLVDALSDRWGSEQDAVGTTSWFELSVDGPGEGSEQLG